MRAGLDAGARVVSVGLGDPAAVRDLAVAAGAPLIAMASSVEDAERAVASGAQVIVAQGAEAGGHRSTFDVPADGVVPLVGTFALVPQVVSAVDVPVVAAGGVMDGRGLAAALALGAQGVQMGSRFLMADESGASAGYRRRVSEARDTDTIITRAVSGRPARGATQPPDRHPRGRRTARRWAGRDRAARHPRSARPPPRSTRLRCRHCGPVRPPAWRAPLTPRA